METTPRPANGQNQNQLVRERATRRLNQITAGAAIAGVVAVLGFAAVNAAIDGATSTSTAATTTTAGMATTTEGFPGITVANTTSRAAQTTTGGS